MADPKLADEPEDLKSQLPLCNNCGKAYRVQEGLLLIVTEINFKHQKQETRHFHFCKRECRADYFNKFEI